MCRVIHSCATGVDLILQTWDRRPQQRHRTRDVRSGHGRAAGIRICVITAVGGRTRARAWSCDIRFDAIAAVPDNRAAAAKRGNGISAGIQSPSRVRCCVERWRIRYSGTS